MMSATNPQTALAATRVATNLNRSLILLGVFKSSSQARALIRANDGALTMLTLGETNDAMTLMETGDGWALVQDKNRIHRLVIA